MPAAGELGCHQAGQDTEHEEPAGAPVFPQHNDRGDEPAYCAGGGDREQ
ncbi:hypothetical protein MHOL44478_09620 [Mycobacterium holsaticum DSM 44478]|nr:hypothetical protein [Mycolicibacterium holsaticum DSM 44478 = JCM 12374]